MLSSRLAACLLLLTSLGCLCGAPEEALELDTLDVAEAPAGAGSWSADIEGICQMEADCGCLEKATVEDCAASLAKSAIVFTDDVNRCIVTQSCTSMCGGGAVRCVNDGAARQSAAESARHQAVMGIMENYPSGGPCANGPTQVVDSSGAFLRCQ